MGGNTYGHVGALLASARLGNRGNNGGEKPPPPTVPSVRHSGAVAVPKRIAQSHSAVQEGGRAEAKAFGGGGGKGGNLKGVFKYLVRVSSAADDDWPAVIRNLTKVRAVWRIMTRILSSKGARPRVSGFSFKRIVHSVLLFDVET